MESEYVQHFIKCLNMTKCDARGESITYGDMVSLFLDALIKLRKNLNRVFFIGNGGSSGIAMHMTVDFLKNGCVKTHSMHDSATLTCLGNDYGYKYVFSKQLEIVAESGDMLIAISSSGNSPNILFAVEVARKKGCHVITLSGFESDNKLRRMGDINIYVPSKEYGIVESIHNVILQQIVDELMVKNSMEANNK